MEDPNTKGNILIFIVLAILLWPLIEKMFQ